MCIYRIGIDLYDIRNDSWLEEYNPKKHANKNEKLRRCIIIFAGRKKNREKNLYRRIYIWKTAAAETHKVYAVSGRL